jgi:hypothetical protein
MTPLGSLVYRWNFNIKMNLKQILGEDMNCIQLTQDVIQEWTPMNMVLNFPVPLPEGYV